MQLFALYNHTEELNHSPRFYSLRVPLQVWKDAGLVTEVHTHWLDHMTQHFTSGAQLVDGFFHLGDQGGTSSCRSADSGNLPHIFVPRSTVSSGYETRQASS